MLYDDDRMEEESESDNESSIIVSENSSESGGNVTNDYETDDSLELIDAIESVAIENKDKENEDKFTKKMLWTREELALEN